jgi:L-iditol 2-dehydrogenase
MKMPAVVNYGAQPGQVELREIDRPSLGEEDVLLEVAAVNVCGSDLHQWTGSQTWSVNYPVVLGHEFAGTVLEAGARVHGFQPHDRVVSETAAVIDPDSPLSRQGLYNLDPSRKGFGYGVDGAMTPMVRVPARCLHHLPTALTMEKAALVEPCSVAYNAVVHHGSVRPGDRIVVLGPGPIGLLSAALARLQGAEVAMVGLPRDQQRLAVAAHYGCTPITGDPTEWALAGDGLGVHGVIDAAGVSATLKAALEIVRPAGWISKVGWGDGPLNFSLDLLVQKSITLRGSFSHHWSIWEKVIGMLTTEQLDVEPIVGGTWPLQQWHQAFEAMHSGQIVKAQLVP